MSRYDGLIIPRSYSEYINKTDAATLLQALQQSGVMDAAPTAGSNHPVKSDGLVPTDTISNSMKAVTAHAVNVALAEYNISNYYFERRTDLNTIVGEPDKVKVYAIFGDTQKNCPANQNGYLTVYNSSTRTRITQTYKSNESYLVWERVSLDGGNTWNSWATFNFTF